jgi:hypothetical protein
MKSSPKTALIVTAIIAVIIIIIWIVTSPSSQVALEQTPAPVVATPAPQGASLTLISPVGGAVEVGQPQHIKWTSQNYTAPTVTINVLRQVSTSPLSYTLVRTVASATANDGDAVWVPAKSDVGTNIVIEVACAVTNEACQSARSTTPIAVATGSKSANTASVYSALEWNENK